MDSKNITANVGVSILDPYVNIFAKQSRKGCLRTLCGCDSATEFKIGTIEKPDSNVFYVKEESGCCCRVFCQPIHPFRMDLKLGSDNQGPLLVQYERPCATHVNPCKCCCFQRIIATDGTNQKYLGQVIEKFYCCVPTFHVEDANHKVINYQFINNYCTF